MKNKITVLLLLISVCSTFAQFGLDTSFGTGGKVITAVSASNNESIIEMEILPDGKFITCGSSDNGSIYTFTLAKYNPNGTLDVAFGTNGIVTTTVGGFHGGTSSLVMQPDGKIIVGGVNGATYDDYDLAIMRFNTNGSIDSTFGINGMVFTDLYGQTNFLTDMVLQNDGKILACGFTETIFEPSSGSENFALVRYNSNGTLDSTFGNGGKIDVNFGNTIDGFGSFDESPKLKILSDGKILLVGISDVSAPRIVFNFALLKLNSDGSIDNTFGTNGKVITDFGNNDIVSSFQILPDDKIIAVGTSRYNSNNNQKMALAKYNANGTLDNTYGTNGKVLLDFNATIQKGYLNSSKILSNGKLLAIGGKNNGLNNDFLMVLFNDDGTLETTFGTNGMIVTDFSNSDDNSGTIIVQPNGDFVLGGNSNANGSYDFAMARYTTTLSNANFETVQFSVFPNPFSDYINLNFNLKEKDNLSINLFDTNGREILNLLDGANFKLGDNSLHFNLPITLSRGIYFLNISNGKTVSNIKIIK